MAVWGEVCGGPGASATAAATSCPGTHTDMAYLSGTARTPTCGTIHKCVDVEVKIISKHQQSGLGQFAHHSHYLYHHHSLTDEL